MDTFRLSLICMILKCIIVDNLANTNDSSEIYEKDTLKLMEMEVKKVKKRDTNNGKWKSISFQNVAGIIRF